MTPSPTTLETNDVLAQRYRLEREAARTEVGVVFEANDLTLARSVAVEVASSLHEPGARRNWLRDAMLAQRLEGEHVLRVLDVGTLPSGVPFVVREAATVDTLASEMERRGSVPIAQAVAWTLEACEAVAEAHALGMAHGDLRLDNMVLARSAPDAIVKVVWTSAAKAERAAREDVARDVAGLGAMLRVLVTGNTDIEADGASTLPNGLAHTVARALSQTREGAFRNVSELAQALAPFAPPGHGSARTVALLMSRAGIVGGGSIAIEPRSALGLPTERERDRTAFTDEWFNRASRPPVAQVAQVVAPRKRGATFALVSLGLVAGVLGGSLLLRDAGRLPHWTGTGPPEPVGSSEITSGTPESANVERADPGAAAETGLAPVPIDSLPNLAPESAAAMAAPTAAIPAAPVAPIAAAAAAAPAALVAKPKEPRAEEPMTPVPTRVVTPDDSSTTTTSPPPSTAPGAPSEAPATPAPAPAATDSVY